ncbi:MAG: hypothetical protein WC346_07800 [Methanogenium sp.]|jgi:hypothetical protein
MEITITTAVLIALTIGIVKALTALKLNVKLAPIAAIVIGIGLSVAAYYAVDYKLINIIIGGIVVGLTSVGLYSGVKNTSELGSTDLKK